MNGIDKRSHLALVLAAALAVGGLYGCKQEGPAETAGKNIDNAVEKTGEALEKAGEKTGDALEKAGEKIEDTVKGEKK